MNASIGIYHLVGNGAGAFLCAWEEERADSAAVNEFVNGAGEGLFAKRIVASYLISISISIQLLMPFF